MSPTSYQTAPPRMIMVAHGGWGVNAFSHSGILEAS
jgi:hypothetical protein